MLLACLVGSGGVACAAQTGPMLGPAAGGRPGVTPGFGSAEPLGPIRGAAQAEAQRAALDADALTKIFAATCLAHVGDAAAVRRAALARHLLPMPDTRARALLARPGMVFDGTVPGGTLAVLSFDSGLCGTMADNVDAGSLLASLATVTRQAGIAVRALGTAPAGAAQGYRLTGPGVRATLMVNISSFGGHSQASLLASPLPAPVPQSVSPPDAPPPDVPSGGENPLLTPPPPGTPGAPG